MVQKKVWATCDYGGIDYISLTPEYLDEAMEVLRKSFYPYEAASMAVGLTEDLEAMGEMDNLILDVAKEGVSIIAVERKTNTVCGVAVNKLHAHSKDEPDHNFLDVYFKTCKRRRFREILEFMEVADSQINLFDVCKVDCILEVMFLTTSTDFTKRGIGLKLCQASIDLVKALKMKNNVKQSIDGTVLPLEPIPQGVSALFTSPYSQKIGRTLNWQLAGKISFDKFYANGKTFSSVLGSYVKYLTVECTKI